ncbi:MAG: hypothetical protein HPY64_17700 [Anaerolineae bacterium]|nr:hypothetical protein [Anaerolineae bacterium]
MTSGRQLPWPALIAVVLLAFMLRLLQLDASPLRGDEAFAIQYWAAPWPEGLALTRVEPHPYGTFAIFALWKSLLGDSEWVMRLLPALGNMPGLAGAYVIGRRLFRDQRAGLLAIFLYAIHPHLIWHAQDVRNYALWAAATPVSAAALLVALDSGRLRNWVRYGAAVTLSAYVFFFALFFLVAHGIYVALFRRARLRHWVMAAFGIAVLLVPLALQVLAIVREGQYAGTAGGFVLGQLWTWFLPTLTIGDTLPAGLMAWLWAPLVVVVVGGLYGLWRWRRYVNAVGYLATELVVPVVLLGLVCLRMDVFRPRYLLPLGADLALLLAGTLFALLSARGKYLRSVGYVVVAAILLLDGWALVNYYTNPAYAKALDWRTLGAFMTAETRPDELVIQQALDPAFTYYFRGPAAETTLPLRANAPAEETIAYLEDAQQRYTRLWLIPADLPYYDAEHVPLTWLTEEMQIIADLSVAGFHVLQFQSWDVADSEYTRRVNARFADIATLLDWRVDQLGRGMLRLTVYWEPTARSISALTGFAHLVGPPHPDTGLPLWAQDDHPLATAHWQTGHVRRDVYLLSVPDSPPSGNWQLHVGLYDPATLERVPVGADDHFTIQLGADPLANIP